MYNYLMNNLVHMVTEVQILIFESSSVFPPLLRQGTFFSTVSINPKGIKSRLDPDAQVR